MNNVQRARVGSLQACVGMGDEQAGVIFKPRSYRHVALTLTTIEMNNFRKNSVNKIITVNG